MKQLILASVLVISFVACNDNKNAKTTAADSTNMTNAATSAPDTLQSTQGAASGTTGTGTVSDSGNAANPGSDTTYKK